MNPPVNLVDGPDAPWMRALLDYSSKGFGRQAGLYEGSTAPGLWDDMEQIGRDDARWDQATEGLGSSGDRRFIPKAGSFLSNLAAKHPGAITTLDDPHGGGVQHSIDWSKLPRTAFGSPENTLAINRLNKGGVLNDKFVYDDPNYGSVTGGANYKSGRDWVGPALIALLTMGAGAIGAAGMGTAMSGARAASSAARGDWLGAGLGLLGPLGGAAGIPSWATGLARTGLSMGLNNQRSSNQQASQQQRLADAIRRWRAGGGG
jgi:hypothetical protein